MIISLGNSIVFDKFESLKIRNVGPHRYKADENKTHPLHRVGWEESRCSPSHTPAPVDNNPQHWRWKEKT
jgi:hypothetical protein